MADYVSSLTGSAMDAALLDMAEHNSEAWAVGERNGVPVGSDDVTYQNNAQYYAQQAQSIAPASVTEAVRWDIAQTALTDANKEQARSNIDAGKNGAWSNPNLIDNAYFVGGGSQLGDGVFPINQRGQASYAGGATTTLDRWWQQYDATVTLMSAGLRLTGKWNISQRLPSVLPNGTYTFSVNVVTLNSAGVTIFFIDQSDQIVAGATKVIDSTGITSLTITSDQIKGVAINLTNPSGTGDITIASAKLELGTVSTLANDAPHDFGEEMRKCQRYLWVHKFAAYDVVGNGYAASTTVGGFSICLPVSMRTGGNPQATYTTLPSAYGGGSASNLSTMNLASLTGNIARYYVEFSGIPANNSICVMATTDTTITISNEL